MKQINNGELRKTAIGQNVTLFGFVANKRKMGGLIFVDLRDRFGITQIVIRDLALNFTKESVLKVEGKVMLRQQINPHLPTGEIEVLAHKITILSLAAPELPFVIRDDLAAKEDTRLKHRFLDLRRPTMYHNLSVRHKTIKAIRDFLDAQKFLEIETPLLAKSTPEGARDFLVPTRQEGKFFALPQSPQLYKQLLMASGIEAYFQIVRCFRDEDSRKDRQPEFTQLDLELSYVKPEAIQALIEAMFVFVWKKLGLNTNLEFAHIDYAQAIDLYGTDKPDLRYDHQLIEVTNMFTQSQFKPFQQASNIKMLVISEILTNKQVKFLEQIAVKNGASALMWATFHTATNLEKGPGFKFIAEELKLIIKKHKYHQGTLIFVANEHHISTKAMGAIRVELAEMFNWADPILQKFVWIENWPLFEKDKETGQPTAAHHPFTAPALANQQDFDLNPLSAKAQAYDLVLNGYEIGGGSVRINDFNTQKRMFQVLGLTQEQYEAQFGFFLEAFKYGLPPHAGIAFGLDRLVMIITQATSIREVIAFPKNANGLAVMEDAPAKVSSAQLDDYFLKLK